jgi:hypothetical protein
MDYIETTIQRKSTPAIVEMMIRWNKDQYRIRVLLDTGCFIPLLAAELTKKLKIPCHKHEQRINIRDFKGNLVQGAGQFYTTPIILQYRNHYTREVFEVVPLEPRVNAFLP